MWTSKPSCSSSQEQFQNSERAQSLPIAINGAFEGELDWLDATGIVERVTQCDWASPIVTAQKKAGGFHIYGDYKVTANGALDVDQYHLPNPCELLATLAGGKKFTKPDLSQAYQQLLLDQESTRYFMVNTHNRLYRYNETSFWYSLSSCYFSENPKYHFTRSSSSYMLY